MRDEIVAWPDGLADGGQTSFLETTARHGLTPLIGWQLRREGFEAWPERIRSELTSAVRGALAAEQVSLSELRSILSALENAGVPALVMKGWALAYSHYAHPWLRIRDDIDLFVGKGDVSASQVVFARLGYRAPLRPPAELAFNQVQYGRRDRYGLEHWCDVHWKLSDAQLFVNLLSFDEIKRRAVSMPALGPRALAPHAAHALFVACIHRVAHHYDTLHLRWLYDIHLLVERMTPEELQEFVDLAQTTRMSIVCARGLALARAWFHTVVPSEILRRLEEERRRENRMGGIGSFLGGPKRPIHRLLSDLRALAKWRDRAKLLREYLFPPAQYILAAYGVSTRAALPLLYARRLVRGTRKWLRTPDQE